MCDVNNDGLLDVAVATYAGEVRLCRFSLVQRRLVRPSAPDNLLSTAGWPSRYCEPTPHALDRTHPHAFLARQVHFFDRYGEEMEDRTIFLERLRVRKRWYKGLADDHVDHRMPDIRDTFEGELLQEEEPGQVRARSRRRRRRLSQSPHYAHGFAHRRFCALGIPYDGPRQTLEPTCFK